MIETFIHIIFLLTILSSIYYAFRGAKDSGEEPEIIETPHVAIILPVKDPPNLDPLIEGIDKEELDIDLHIVYQGDRPQIGYRAGNINVYIHEGGEEPGYIGKIGNLIKLLTKLDLEGYDYIVFIDDDIIPHRGWLRELIGLAEKYCIASGYRLYLPKPLNIGNIFLSVWNLYSLETMYGGDRIVWGGSAAFKKSVFRRDILRRLWRKAVSDDVAYTHIARCNGIKIGFNEKVLLISRPFKNLWEALNFIIRQQRIVYTYSYRLWLKGLLIHLYLNLLTIILLLNIYLTVFLGIINPFTILEIISIIMLYLSYILKGHLRIDRFSKLFGEEHMREFRIFKLVNLLFMPILLNIQSILLLISRGETIYWRGRYYILPRPEDLGYNECRYSVIEEHPCKKEEYKA